MRKKTMWYGLNVKRGGCASISSACLLRDLVNRLWYVYNILMKEDMNDYIT